MRRRPGLQGLQQTAANRQQLRALGERVEEANISVMRAQMATFKAALEQFAANHREEIRKNPEFRQQFHAMCASINVDPLVSNKGGTWAQKLGLGDFYYALAVTVLDVCRARRQYDGGLTELAVVHRHVSRRRGGAADPINEDDIVRALQKLSVLGGGLGVITVGGRRFVRSVPAELSTDANAILELAGVLGGFFQRADVASNLGWGEERTSDALTALAREGLILVDDPPDVPAEHPAHRMYWCPAVGMEEAVEEYQRREGLTVTGFRGLKARADEDEEYRVE
jgi:ESCRT-II complex subunit VPS22